MPAVAPIRLKFTEAMTALAVSRSTLSRLLDRGLFTVVRPAGVKGRGQRVYLLADEVEVYARRGEDALAEHRAKQSTPKARRPA